MRPSAIGLSHGNGVSEMAELSHGNGVSEMVEYCEKVPRTSTRLHVDLVPGKNGTGTCLTHADT
jgi:hypothetical protein